ncbi:MAG TPA: YdcF family protein [Rhizobiaceae bacterium]|nr:YdcF family protein [Rhizobiaceae bacterium]
MSAPTRSVRGKARLAAALKLAALIVLLTMIAFAGGFGWFATHVSRLATPDDPGKADAIIVLTGGQSRIDAAVNLLKSGKGKRLLISGVHPTARLRDLQAVTGGDKALFSCCVDIDHAALDTVGNAEESAKWVTSHAYSRVILVTNNYHIPRSLLEMRRYIGTADLLPYPVVNRRPDDGGWMTNPDAVRVLFTEYTKYLAALARGVIPIRGAPPPLTIVKAPSDSVSQ